MIPPESTSPSQNIPPFKPNYICDPPRIFPSLPEYIPFFNQFICATLPELPLPPRIYPPFQQLYATISESTPPSLPEYTAPPLFNNYMRPSQNLPLPLRIYPHITTICDPPRIYPSLPEYTLLFNNYNIMRPF